MRRKMKYLETDFEVLTHVFFLKLYLLPVYSEVERFASLCLDFRKLSRHVGRTDKY